MPDGRGLFRGTAAWYAQFRRGYPVGVFDLLEAQAPLTRASRVLDLGCGTGQVALSLAARVASVTGVDADDDMLAEAAAAAERAGTKNCRWVHGSAESFADAADSYDLVVAASAFHWMDRALVASNVHELLASGRLFAVLGNPTPLNLIRRREGIGSVIAEVQDRWFGPEDSPRSAAPEARHEDVLVACG